MICFFNTIESWGGGEKWHYEMAVEISKAERVLFFCAKNSVLADKLKLVNTIDVEFCSVKNFSYLNFSKLKKTSSIFEKHRVSTVVLNSSQDMKFGGLAAKKAGVSRIIYRRGSAIPIKNTLINRYFFKNVVTEVLANSEATKKTINQNNQNLFPKKKITVIPNSIDLDFLDKDFELLYKKKNNEIIIGNLGRSVYQKNQKFLIEVAKELQKREVNFKLLIGGEGKLLNQLKEKAQKLNVSNCIDFLGFIENPKSFMMSLDIFVLPSHWEGFGYVLAEAMLCEKPVVAFNISSNSQLVQDNQTGFLTPYQNVELFCNKVEYLAHHPNKRMELGQQGKQFVIKNFNQTVIKNRVKQYLKN